MEAKTTNNNQEEESNTIINDEEVQPLSIEGPPLVRRKGWNLRRSKHCLAIFGLGIVCLLIVRSYDIHSTSETQEESNQKETKQTRVVSKEDGVMFEIIGNMLYHNNSHFTQGLTYSKSSNVLFESNGLFGKSSLCRLDPDTGIALQCKVMEKALFAEGMQVYGYGREEKLIQITWKSQRGFIYKAETLEQIAEFKFKTTKNEGWGICLDENSHEFIVSDGSNFLHFWDVDTLKEKRRLEVTRMNGKPAKNLNELEFVNGKVLANVWYEDVILVIDPISGECESEYDFSELWPQDTRRQERADVLNGISISKDDGVLYVTGKNWNRMHKVKLTGF